MKNKATILLFFVLMALPIHATAGIFKCINAKSKTTFQAKPCAADNKASKVVYKTKKISKDAQCKINCKAKYNVCLANQDGTIWNSDGGIDLCQQEKEACFVGCNDPAEGRYLSSLADIERSSYESEKKYKKRLKDIDKRYKKNIKKANKDNCQWYRDRLFEAEKSWKTKRRSGYNAGYKKYHQEKINRAMRDVNKEC